MHDGVKANQKGALVDTLLVCMKKIDLFLM